MKSWSGSCSEKMILVPGNGSGAVHSDLLPSLPTSKAGIGRKGKAEDVVVSLQVLSDPLT